MLPLAGGLLSPWLAEFHLEYFTRGGSSALTMKGGHDQMKNRCGFYSKLGYCEGAVKELVVGGLGEKLPPTAPPVDETLAGDQNGASGIGKMMDEVDHSCWYSLILMPI